MTVDATSMDGFVTDRETPEPVVADPTPIEPVVEVVSETPEPVTPEPGETQAQAEARDAKGRFTKSGKPRDDAQARIAQLTARQREVERERDDLKARLAAVDVPAIPSLPAPSSSVTGLRPAPSEDEIGTKYASYAEFTLDQARWVREEERAQESVKAVEHDALRARSRYAESARVASERFPDFETVVNAVDDIKFPQAFEAALLATSDPVAVSHYLATHREDYAQLVARPIRSHDAAELMRDLLETKVQAAAPARPASAPRPSTSAPPPIKPVGSAPVMATETPDDLEFGPEYVRRMNERERAQRRLR